MPHSDRKRRGQKQFLWGLTILLASWILERGATEYYQGRETEIEGALSTANSNFLDIKIDRLAVDLASFRNEVWQIELKKISFEYPPSSPQGKKIEASLHKSQEEVKTLSKKDEEQSQAAVQAVLGSVRHLDPNKGKELRKQWNDLIDSVRPNEDIRGALRGRLADPFSAWKDKFRQEILDEYGHVLLWRWWSERIFKLLYLIGSVFVINGERMRWEGGEQARR